MVVRTRRVYDCKRNAEVAMTKLGYKVNSRKQEYLQSKECVVTYSDVSIEVLTQSEYEVTVEMRISFMIDDNNILPYEVVDVLKNVTDYVENSDADESTSFIFKRISIIEMNEAFLVEIYGTIEFEVNWVGEQSWCGPDNTEPPVNSPIDF